MKQNRVWIETDREWTECESQSEFIKKSGNNQKLKANQFLKNNPIRQFKSKYKSENELEIYSESERSSESRPEINFKSEYESESENGLLLTEIIIL